MVQFLLQTSWWMPCYGLVGAFLTLPWSTGVVRRTGPRPAAYFNLLMTILAFVHGLIVFQQTWRQPPQTLVWHWLQLADLDLSFNLSISPVSLGAISMITGFSLLSQFFALGYMEKDWALARFFGLMGFFEATMSGLALSDSLFLSYALLEMLTMSTYLLVGFWYAQPLVVTAARDAFLTKRVGDILLLMGIVSLSCLTPDLNFPSLYEWAAGNPLSPALATLLGLALVAGPTGKCAQFPLHLWLDEAMEGPNPASSLRNSVVVACGAYVLIKLQPLISLSPIAMNTLIVIGTITAIGESFVALAQIDIKRTFSHATSAYLGLVFIAVGSHHTDFALLLLLTHGFAKALLFMSVGSVILTTNSQDLTELGGLGSRMPATTIAYGVGALGLVGLLPLGCFWAFALEADHFWDEGSWVFLLVLLMVNGLTALNLTRVYRLVFGGAAQAKTRRAPEVAWPMAVPMVVLTVLTLLLPLVMQQVGLLANTSGLIEAPTLLLVLSGAVGGLVGTQIVLNQAWVLPQKKFWRIAQDFFAYDFYIDLLYKKTIVAAVVWVSQVSAWFDRTVVDGLINLVGFVSILSGESLKYSISGRSQSYMLTIVMGVGLLLGAMLLSFVSVGGAAGG
jgi:NAD(P)H-quinone oxidoreductase subunit 5